MQKLKFQGKLNQHIVHQTLRLHKSQKKDIKF